MKPNSCSIRDLKLRIMSQQIDRMGVQQAHSRAPSKPKNSIRLPWGPLSRGVGQKWQQSGNVGWNGPLITEQSSCSHKDGHRNNQPLPRLRDQAAASGPVSSTKADTRFPLQTWPCSSYLITKWTCLLQREKSSCRLCSQLLLQLPVLWTICHLFLPCFFHSCMCTQMHLLYSPGPRVITHVRDSAYQTHALTIFPSFLLLFINIPFSVLLDTSCTVIGNIKHDLHFHRAQKLVRDKEVIIPATVHRGIIVCNLVFWVV